MNQVNAQAKVMYEESAGERQARLLYEDTLIAVYVPEADLMTRDKALALAIERDEEAAFILKDSSLNLETAVEVSRELL